MATLSALVLGLLLLPLQSGPSVDPTLTIVWSDSRHLFAPGLVGMLDSELQGLFRPHGIAVKLHVLRVGEDLRRIPEPRLQAIVTPAEGSRYFLHRDAMAATIGERGSRRNVFVFFPGLSRTLGHEGTSYTPRRGIELARAMARVLAHEIVHVLAPERGHAAEGLMSEQLKRGDLVSSAVSLDDHSARLAKTELRRWMSPEPTVAAAPEESTGKPPAPALAPGTEDCMFQIS